MAVTAMGLTGKSLIVYPGKYYLLFIEKLYWIRKYGQQYEHRISADRWDRCIIYTVFHSE